MAALPVSAAKVLLVALLAVAAPVPPLAFCAPHNAPATARTPAAGDATGHADAYTQRHACSLPQQGLAATMTACP
jgi:hypothetical protein